MTFQPELPNTNFSAVLSVISNYLIKLVVSLLISNYQSLTERIVCLSEKKGSIIHYALVLCQETQYLKIMTNIMHSLGSHWKIVDLTQFEINKNMTRIKQSDPGQMELKIDLAKSQSKINQNLIAF